MCLPQNLRVQIHFSVHEIEHPLVIHHSDFPIEILQAFQFNKCKVYVDNIEATVESNLFH